MGFGWLVPLVRGFGDLPSRLRSLDILEFELQFKAEAALALALEIRALGTIPLLKSREYRHSRSAKADAILVELIRIRDWARSRFGMLDTKRVSVIKCHEAQSIHEIQTHHQTPQQKPDMPFPFTSLLRSPEVTKAIGCF